MGQRIGGLLRRREFVAVLVMIFAADLGTGIFSPTFSLYATSLGATFTLIGLLSSVVGLTRIVASIPIGMVSDAVGRKPILMGGMFLLAASSYLYTVVSNPYLLLPMRMMTGIVITSTFFIGMVYVGDVVPYADRGLASGIYTTCMGLGFTLGSILGGKMAASLGYGPTFRTAAVLALIGFGVAWWGLSSKRERRPAGVRAPSPSGKLGMLARQPALLAVSLGYLLTILTFDAAIVNFFPLYAASWSIGQAAVGVMFSLRALASTSVRLPTGVLTTRFASRSLMLAGLCLGMVTVFSICCLRSPVPLTLALAGEGIGFGMYLTAGQAFITQRFGESERGTAMGVYSMTGSIGVTVGPLVLGAVADLWGLKSVFWVTGIVVALGIGAILAIMTRERAAERLTAGGESRGALGG